MQITEVVNKNNEFLPNYTVRQMHRKMVKSDLISGLISGGHIRPGPDMTGYENLAGFQPRPGPDMISGATLVFNNIRVNILCTVL